MKRSIAIYVLLAMATLSLMGVGQTADASFRDDAQTNNKEKKFGYDMMLEAKSEILGVSVEELKQELASGKTFPEIVKASGISFLDFHNQMKEIRLQQFDEHIRQLVSDGILTPEQADEKIAWMQNNNGLKNQRGFRMGIHRAFGSFSN